MEHAQTLVQFRESKKETEAYLAACLAKFEQEFNTKLVRIRMGSTPYYQSGGTAWNGEIELDFTI